MIDGTVVADKFRTEMPYNFHHLYCRVNKHVNKYNWTQLGYLVKSDSVKIYTTSQIHLI